MDKSLLTYIYWCWWQNLMLPLLSADDQAAAWRLNIKLMHLDVCFVRAHHDKKLVLYFPDIGDADGLYWNHSEFIFGPWAGFASVVNLKITIRWWTVDPKSPFYSASRDVTIHDVIQTL